MLEKALAEDPDNVDVQVALAALLMRGVQMVWLSAAERETAETKAEALLQQTLRAKPKPYPGARGLLPLPQRHQPVPRQSRRMRASPELRSVERHRAVSCRPCANPNRALRGCAGDLQAGGPVRHPAGVALDMDDRRGLGQHADGPCRRRRAVAAEVDRDHLRQRTHAHAAGGGLSATGQDRAKPERRWKRARELRPGSTYRNVPPPTKNSSPVYLDASERIMQLMVAAGLPES